MLVDDRYSKRNVDLNIACCLTSRSASCALSHGRSYIRTLCASRIVYRVLRTTVHTSCSPRNECRCRRVGGAHLSIVIVQLCTWSCHGVGEIFQASRDTRSRMCVCVCAYVVKCHKFNVSVYFDLPVNFQGARLCCQRKKGCNSGASSNWHARRYGWLCP